ncbi:unnamed protein product [Allacma fusca]|uniref:Serpin domain-containing protein n=1 Tax=Allacma fusca TaxID=39272 RepID=A0A8J2KUN9_9HEXA|nr:unnamed protein product [Allacma fusca]
MSEGESETVAVPGTSEGISFLSAELFLDLSASHTEDLIFSPFALSAALAAIKLSCQGQSMEEISQVLHFPSDDEILKKEHSDVLAPFLQESIMEDCTFYTFNKIYLPHQLQINGELVDISLKADWSNFADSLGVEILSVNYEDCSTLEDINNNVEIITEGKVQEIVSADVLNGNCNVALVSAMYLKGEWKYKFDERSTRSSEFHLNEEETFLVDMMHVRNDRIPYQVYDDLDAQAVTLPFKGDRLIMVVFVPLQVDGLVKIEKVLRKLARKGIPSSKYIPKFECRVRVYLPRFRIESSMDFVEPLQNLGIQTIFNDESPNFGAILDNPEINGLRISHIIQKVVIEVDEGGSKAAPARSMSSSSSFGSDVRKPTTSYFIADRPFLFQIVDSTTDVGELHRHFISNKYYKYRNSMKPKIQKPFPGIASVTMIFERPRYICVFIFVFVVLNGFPATDGVDCYDAWSDCIRELKSDFELENDGAKETEGDTMVMHYQCVDSAVDKSAGCLKEITDGVCNSEDKELATSMGSETLEELSGYCAKWKLKF